MRQVVSADKDVTRRDRHVLCKLMLDGKVALIGVCILEFLIREKRERQYRAEARERLIIETLAPKLILRTRRGTGRTVDARDSSRGITDDYRALKDLRGIQKDCRRRIVEGQSGLLLLRRVRNVRVKGDS